MLTEAQAWRKIARKIVTGKWGKRGLCYEVEELGWSDQISDDTEMRMYRRIGNVHNEWAYHMRDGFVGEEPEGRALAALLFAVQAKDEYKKKVKNKK
jgi:hypothetical protein